MMNKEIILNRFLEARLLFNSFEFVIKDIDKYAFSVRTRNSNLNKLKRILVVAVVHGNETGGIESIFELSKWFAQSISDSVELTLVLGNVPAVILGKRFVDLDLNRSFGMSCGDKAEHILAKRLESLIKDADAVVDIHQTIQPSESGFLIFPYSQRVLEFAEFVADQNAIVTYQGQFSDEGCTLDVYAHNKGKLAFTYEMGQVGLHAEQINKSSLLLKRVVNFFENDQMQIKNNIQCYTFSDFIIKTEPGRRLVDGLKNFTHVLKGQLLAEGGSGPVYADRNVYILFPKYGEYVANSSDLCRTIIPISREEILKWQE